LSKFEGFRGSLQSWVNDLRSNASAPPSVRLLVAYLALIGFCNYLVWDISEAAQRCDLNKIEIQVENLDRKQSLVELKIDSLILASRFGDKIINDQEYWSKTEQNLKTITNIGNQIRSAEKSYAKLCDDTDSIHRETLILFLFVTFIFGLMTVLSSGKVERKNRKKNV
jgi:hypothetical protein